MSSNDELQQKQVNAALLPAEQVVSLSKAMTRVLRPPGAVSDWVALPVLVQRLGKGVTEAQVRQVLSSQDKLRFVMDDSSQPARVRTALPLRATPPAASSCGRPFASESGAAPVAGALHPPAAAGAPAAAASAPAGAATLPSAAQQTSTSQGTATAAAPVAGTGRCAGRGQATGQARGGGRQTSSGAAKRGSAAQDEDVRVSKAMSRVLRHAPPPGAMDAQGWVALPVLVQHLGKGITEEKVRRVVASNDKKRYVLDDDSQPPRIRAAQGHSVELEDPVLEPVTDAAQVPVVVHVTSKDGWSLIQQDGYLRRMNRSHIHLATSPVHMRTNSWAQVLLRLDLQAALAAGHLFWLSSNGVLLCEGPLPVTFVASVQASDLPLEWQAARSGFRQAARPAV